MNIRRYGKFKFCDYISAWFAITFLFVLVVVGFLTDTQFYLSIWPLLLIVIMALSIFSPNNESFLLSGDTIMIMKGKKKQKVSIPPEATLIVSYADVCPTFAKRISYGNQTYILRGRYAISILQKMPMETILEQLHRNYTHKYTNSIVESCFDEYVYSFVGNQELLDKLVANKKYQIIIPETLLKQISIDINRINLHIDSGY